jgi:hypothetical protein
MCVCVCVCECVCVHTYIYIIHIYIHIYIHTYLYSCIHTHTERERERERVAYIRDFMKKTHVKRKKIKNPKLNPSILNTSYFFGFFFYFTSFTPLYSPCKYQIHPSTHPPILLTLLTLLKELIILHQPAQLTIHTHTHIHKRAGNAGFAHMLLNAYNIHTLTHTHTHTHTHRRAGNAGFAHMLLNATASRAVTHNQGCGSLAGGEGVMGPGRDGDGERFAQEKKLSSAD